MKDIINKNLEGIRRKYVHIASNDSKKYINLNNTNKSHCFDNFHAIIIFKELRKGTRRTQPLSGSPELKLEYQGIL